MFRRESEPSEHILALSLRDLLHNPAEGSTAFPRNNDKLVPCHGVTPQKAGFTLLKLTSFPVEMPRMVLVHCSGVTGLLQAGVHC